MALAIKSFYEFDEFRLDPEEKVLLRRGKPVDLRPRVYQLLATLVENHGRIVEKDDLMNQVWADSFVEESNLTFTVRQLRKVLGDDAHEPRFIETVPRRGYRFIAEVKEVLTDEFPGNPNLSVKLNYEAQSETSDELLLDETVEKKTNSQLAGQARKRQTYIILGLITFTAIILVVSGFIYRATYSQASAPNFRQTKLTRLTSFGNSHLAAISPDGKYIVHVKDEGGKQSLWVRQTNETRDIEIVPASEMEFYGVTVSPDSRRVFYTAWDVNKSDLVLYQAPILGGTPQKVIANITSAVTFSPDGERIAFFHSAPSMGISHLIITKADGSEEKILAKRKIPDTFETYFGSPAWSPDGKSIVAVGASMTWGVKSNLIVFNVDDGSERPLNEPKWVQIEQVAWLREGSGLLMIARDESSHPKQIWHVSYPSGEARKVTNDLNDYRGLSLTADSKTLVTTQLEQTTNLWVSASDSIEKAKLILSETGANGGTEGLSWTHDGKIIFRFGENGQDDIWQIGTDGSERKQLTVNSNNNVQPIVCVGGKAIVFASQRTGVYRLWRMDQDGGNPKLLTTKADDAELYPHCAPDGDWVVYQKGWRRGAIWKVPLEGGEPSPISDAISMRPAVSPDGKLVAYYYLGDDVWGLGVISIEGGKPLQKFPLSVSVVSRFVRWTPDGKALAYIDTRDGVSNIWLQPLDKSSPHQLTSFNAERIFYFDWSSDGKNFAVTRGTTTSDVVSIGSVD
jgi:Tol biopolymer transport system component/DNA-binding winged helix-turn-helix (wHTH) protein